MNYGISILNYNYYLKIFKFSWRLDSSNFMRGLDKGVTEQRVLG